MANIKVDLIQEVFAREEFGELVEATVGARVRIARAEIPEGLYAYVLGSTLTDLPQPNESFDDDHTELRVESRVIDEVMSLDEDTVSVHVTINYVLQRAAAGFTVRGSAGSVSERFGTDLAGAAIKVQDNPSVGPVNLVSTTVEAFSAVPTLSYETVESTDSPDALMLTWINTLNDATFRSQTAGKWRIAAVSYEPADLSTSPKKFHFNWDLAFNSRGWQPTATYVDKATGEIPENLDDEGRKTIIIYPTASFTAQFT